MLLDGEIQGHTGQPSVREIDAHTMYNQWATAPGRSLNYPRPKSITHLRTFSDNGVYVALQLFLVILVSDQWRRVLIPYSYRQVPWGVLHARGWLSQYTWDQRLYVVFEPRETHSPMLKARFLHLTILVAAGIEPPTSWLPGQRVTTQPQLSNSSHLWHIRETVIVTTKLLISFYWQEDQIIPWHDHTIVPVHGHVG